ncbi:MAG: hypothetical protein PW792_02400 [Acidobacteriaceae bacterium]|nr:hypothetical protein [Acidobacteriaceae bacterium]
MLMEMMHTSVDSPFVVPVAGCAMILGMSVASYWSDVRKRQLQSQERLAAIARGVPVPPTEEELAIIHGKPAQTQMRRRANLRLTAYVLLASAGGVIVFFIALASILQVRNVLCGAAAGVIPLAMGLGFLWDVRKQTEEIDEVNESGLKVPE